MGSVADFAREPPECAYERLCAILSGDAWMRLDDVEALTRLLGLELSIKVSLKEADQASECDAVARKWTLQSSMGQVRAQRDTHASWRGPEATRPGLCRMTRVDGDLPSRNDVPSDAIRLACPSLSENLAARWMTGMLTMNLPDSFA